MKSSSFSIKSGEVEKFTKKILQYKFEVQKKLVGKVGMATEIAFRTATAKRPMITTAQAKAEGRRKVMGSAGKMVYKRVSDPNATLGVPVDKGILKGSIVKEVKVQGDKIVGSVSTDMEYASPIEFGTSKMPARPFMRPALQLNQDIIKRIFREKDK